MLVIKPVSKYEFDVFFGSCEWNEHEWCRCKVHKDRITGERTVQRVSKQPIPKALWETIKTSVLVKVK